MKAPTTLSYRPAVDERAAVLRRLDFKRIEAGWRRDGVLFCTEADWLVFATDWPDTADPLSDHLGKPGLWKPARVGPQLRRVFTVPESLARETEALSFDDDRGPFECVVEWALASAEGVLPSGWTAPERASVSGCLDKIRLTLVHRSFTRQIQVIHEPARLALRLPILLSVAANLPEARLRWLRALLDEAQNGHHLFRLGFAREGAQTSVVAEIDLTGVPSMLLEPLLSKSCDALRWVAAWLIESADFLAQADVASRALEICAVPEPNP